VRSVDCSLEEELFEEVELEEKVVVAESCVVERRRGLDSDLEPEWEREDRGSLFKDLRRLVGGSGLEELEEVKLRRAPQLGFWG
jgi:hypothetical protein